MGNCFAKNKLPGCFKLKRRPRDSIFYQRNPIFSHYVNLVALIVQSLTGGLPAVALGPGSWCWACSPALARGRKLEGPLGRGHPPPPPCTLVAHHQGVFISMEKGLQEAVVAVAPNLGAPGWAGCSWGGWGGRGTRPHQHTFFYLLLCVFFPLLKGISWFLKHSVGDILVKMQYFYVM